MPFPDHPRAVLLDALGTLIELQPPAPLLREALARQHGVEVTIEQAEQAMEAEIAFYRAHLDEGRDERSLAALRRACADVVRQALPDSPALPGPDDGRFTDLLLSCLRFHVFDEVPGVLEEIRARGMRTAVISNWDISLHDVLARLDLTPLLDAVLTSAEARARKPAREIFEQALRLVDAQAGFAVHVGDSVVEDVEGARSAGVAPILVRRFTAQDPPGVRTIATLAELPGLLAELPRLFG
jgi:putative hydrolase of the HAD superfamily